MKIIISEQQSNFLLHDLLDELFKGYREEYVATGEKLIYVGDKLMMVWQPTKAILSKDIMEKVQGELFYDSMKEFKNSIKSWLLKNFPVKQGIEMIYGVSFKNFEDDVKIVKRRKNKVVSKFKENIQRIKEVMGLKETVEVPSDSYITMNIKNFPKYKKEISNLLQYKLQSSNGDFVTFKNSVVVDKDPFVKAPILSKDLQKLDNKYLNYMISNGSKQFNSMLYSIFSDYYGLEGKQKPKSEIINCDPSNFKIIGPLVASDDKSLMSYWVSQKGGKVYRIKLPEECATQLDVKDRTTYVTVEPIENRIHFPKGVPEKLRGKKLGTLIYLAMIRKLGYITSSMGSSAEIKMIYQDLLSNPDYNLMSLLLQQQVLVIDKNISEDVKKIFNDFVANKYTDKKSVRISPELKEVLGEDFITWYESLEENPELTIDDKIKKYEGLEPKGGDTVVDTSTGKIYSFYGEWEYKGEKRFQVGNDKFEKMELPLEDKKRFKVIHRSEK